MTSSMTRNLANDARPSVWPVGALCLAIGDALESRFSSLRVSGEVSHFTQASSGHVYFTLKDESGQLKCAMFRQQARLLQQPLREGAKVVVSGRLSVYAPRGDVQIIVESIALAGAGDLYERFLQLKSRLQAEGLFDEANKRAIPLYPKKIGLVTSADGAALHDVLTTLKRRAPHIPVCLSPTLVQGDSAPPLIIQALERLKSIPDVDVVLLVRGGGALEDLWAFNDERVVRYLAQAPWPTISGVGHETDFTLTDFVCDLRAATPTAAAQACARSRQDCLVELSHLTDGLSHCITRALDSAHQQLDDCQMSMRQPQLRLKAMGARLDQVSLRLRQAAVLLTQRHSSRVGHLAFRRDGVLPVRLDRARLVLGGLATRLASVHPDQVLQRGFVRMSDDQGRVVTSVHQLKAKQALTAHFQDGKAHLEVQRVSPS